MQSKKTTAGPAPQPEISEEKSQQLACVIQIINQHAMMIDLPYAKLIYSGILEQASMEDTLAPLNRNYDPAKTKLKRAQAWHAAVFDPVHRSSAPGRRDQTAHRPERETIFRHLKNVFMKLFQMSWQDIKAEMSIAGEPERAVKFGREVLDLAAKSMDVHNIPSIENQIFALERTIAELKNWQKILERRQRVTPQKQNPIK
jgi:hypothetical protein